MKIAKYIISVFVCAVVLIGMTLSIFGEKKAFLENENRTPAAAPEFSLNALASGDFTAQTEEFLKDHFPFRDSLMQLKTSAQIHAGYKNIGGVFVSPERLFQEVKYPEKERLTESAKKLFSSIDNKAVRTTVILIPSATEIYPEEMPSHANVIPQSEIIDEILADISPAVGINATEILIEAKEDGNVFYYTDHHWTSFAALEVYNEFCERLEIQHSPLEDYQRTVVSEEFKGTLYSRIPTESVSDTIERFSYPGESFETLYANGARSELQKSEYFAVEHLDKKDKYAYFGNGNLPLMVLENQNSISENEIVVIKDSFANCFIPHLTEYFRKVHIVDPRYYKGKRISAYINENNNISDVLIMYGLNSLNDNSGVSTLS